MKKNLVYSFLLLSVTFVIAQPSAVYTNDAADFQHALSLYNGKNYQAAQTLFNQIKKNTQNPSVEADCAYYIASASIRLNQQSAENLMEDFVEKYPTNIKKNSAFLETADYYFDNGKYPHAIKWYEKVSDASLNHTQRDRLNFRKGYAYFATQNPSEAQKYFNRVTTSQAYGSQAKYYLGYMAYEGDDYNTANIYFEQVEGQAELDKNLAYYLADMNFKQGNFEKAIEEGKKQYARANAQEKSQLSKIIGESYFNLKQYEAAIPYLKAYQGIRGKWNNTDYYLLGYAHYQQGDYKNAVAEFNKIIDGKNAVAQNAYYHLGDAYLKEGKKQQALNAFKHASEMDFSAEIQEDAWYNYAKLSYEIGNIYTSVPEVISSYIEKYPNTNRSKIMEDLLIDSYISSKNYRAAYGLLRQNKTFKNRQTLQKVTFYLGSETASEENYQEALKYFEESLNYNEDEYFNARATFWKAEADYQLGKYSEAYTGFLRFKQLNQAKQTPEYTNIDYHIGYTLFNTRKYTEALTAFQQYLTQPTTHSELEKDARLRLADSYFMNSQYWPAMENYNRVIEAGDVNSDYAAFQKAMAYGFVNRTEKKIESLDAFQQTYIHSPYRGEALFEMGNTYLAQNDNTKALASYDQLIRNLPKSHLVSKALLRKGLIYYNTNRLQEALTEFKKVTVAYPATPEAIQAVQTAELIYKDLGTVNEYAAWVKTLDYVEVTDAQLDQATFDAAEKRYFKNDIEQASVLLQNYLKDFPNAIHRLTAHFYLGQIFYSTDKSEAALHYQKVLALENSQYTEEALVRLSLIYLDKKAYHQTIPLLERLENQAGRTDNVLFAQSNLMKAYYETKNYDKATYYTEKVLNNPASNNEVKKDARVYMARSAMKTGDENKAKTAYAEVLQSATGNLAAEALYYDAYFKNKDKAYAASNEAIQLLAQSHSASKEWGGKGLIIMAKNFYMLNDAFQATYILENVIQNFTEYPEIISEAQRELGIIKQKQAQTNTSVEVD